MAHIRMDWIFWGADFVARIVMSVRLESAERITSPKNKKMHINNPHQDILLL